LGAAANAAAASGSTGSNAAATMMTTATIGPGGGGAAHDGTSGEWETEKPACDSATAVATAEEANPLSSSVAGILELLSLLGAAYHKQCQFQCHAALDLLNRLPEKHQNTGWVLHQQGRAYLELNQFHEARKCLELMRSRDSGRMRGLELLSTVYWQLKKEVELAHLSQHVVDLDRLAPEAWCVVGNCFSLQKDHESALVFFRRSLQLDYDFTYTHTLSGYEYMANEDFDKAIACFRQALRIDERHYNAWYGLGAIYHRQEKYDVAEYHFAKAVSINPSSSVLRCNLGIAQNANGKPYQALDTLNAALRLDSRNPQARFQRATIYFALNQPENALDELRKVRDAAPREATIHFFMGRVLKKLGRLDEAMKCFLTAMDLDPKDNQLIKSAMDKLEEPDVEEETMSSF
jgi:anaphase-promoting complex subunit 3